MARDDESKRDRGFEALGWVALAVVAGCLFWNGLLPALDEVRESRAAARVERARTEEATEARDAARSRLHALERGDPIAERAALLRQGYVPEGHVRLMTPDDPAANR